MFATWLVFLIWKYGGPRITLNRDHRTRLKLLPNIHDYFSNVYQASHFWSNVFQHKQTTSKISDADGCRLLHDIPEKPMKVVEATQGKVSELNLREIYSPRL